MNEMDTAGAVQPNGTSDSPADFHLVEAQGAWRLTIHASDRLRAALGDTTQPYNDVAFTVQVEPNLLPGGVFDVSVDVEHSL